MKNVSDFYNHEQPLLAWSESYLTDLEEAVRLVRGFTNQEALRQALKLPINGDSDLAESCRQRIEKIKQAAETE